MFAFGHHRTKKERSLDALMTVMLCRSIRDESEPQSSDSDLRDCELGRTWLDMDEDARADFRATARDTIQQLSGRNRQLVDIFVRDGTKLRERSFYADLARRASVATGAPISTAVVQRCWKEVRGAVAAELDQRQPNVLEFNRKMLAALRGEPNEVDIQQDKYAELDPDIRSALDSLGPGLAQRMASGSWYFDRFCEAAECNDQAAARGVLARILQDYGGKAMVMLRRILPETSDAVREDILADAIAQIIGDIMGHRLYHGDFRLLLSQRVCDSALRMANRRREYGTLTPLMASHQNLPLGSHLASGAGVDMLKGETPMLLYSRNRERTQRLVVIDGVEISIDDLDALRQLVDELNHVPLSGEEIDRISDGVIAYHSHIFFDAS